MQAQQTLLSMLRVQAEQIEKLTMRLDRLEQGDSSWSDEGSLNDIRREQRRMKALLSAVERQAMSSIDLRDDVDILKKNDSSHRYDLRLLKTSVGDLLTSDKAYGLEVEQSVSNAKLILREAFGEQQTYLTRDILETVKQEVLQIVDSKLNMHLETSSAEAARAADQIIRRDRESEAYYRRTTNSRSYQVETNNGGQNEVHDGDNISFRSTTNQQLFSDPSITMTTKVMQENTQDLEEEFDADKMELEMDLLRLEERIKSAQANANSSSTRY